MKKNRFYTAQETAKLCGSSVDDVFGWIEDGTLPAFRTSHEQIRVKKKDLVKFMKKRGVPVPNELAGPMKATVLVIDDDPNILSLMRAILETKDDLEIITAGNGFEAGIMVYDFLPDIILIDLLMPGIDGFEVCRRLSKDARLNGIPIVAVSALKSERNVKKMSASGISDHLAKPFKAAELIDMLRKYIPSPREPDSYESNE